MRVLWAKINSKEIEQIKMWWHLSFSNFALGDKIWETMSGQPTVLVTGGAGYIGSHCVVALLEAGYNVVALDNFTNSVGSASGESLALKGVEEITGKPVKFYKCDLLDFDCLADIFNKVNWKFVEELYIKY